MPPGVTLMAHSLMMQVERGAHRMCLQFPASITHGFKVFRKFPFLIRFPAVNGTHKGTRSSSCQKVVAVSFLLLLKIDAIVAGRYQTAVWEDKLKKGGR